MLKGIAVLKIPIAAFVFFCTAAAAQYIGGTGISSVASSSGSSVNRGPCDLVSCAEAYSVDRAMTTGYNGPLFQLYNGSSTLDIGQTSQHQVDLTTWSAFCSGIASNCVYGKLYAQINITSNDLVPSIVSAPFGPNCSTGTAYLCAAPFAIEAATGLPIINMVTPQEYTIVSDSASVGINGAGADESIVYNGTGIHPASPYCCGIFGTAHKYNASDTVGTDFLIWFGYGNAGTFCKAGSSTTFSMGLEEEQVCDQADYGSSVISLIGIVTFNQASNTVTGSVNGHSLFSNSPPAGTPLNSGLRIHFGGGGDLSQPAPVIMREALITNTPLTSPQQASIISNMKAYFPAISFP